MKFDYALFDIWQGDGEGTFFDMVMPLHKLSEGIVKKIPVCWQEDVMRGQLLWSLESKRLFLNPEARTHLKLSKDLDLTKEKGDKYWDWACPFWRWYEERKPEEGLFQRAASWYASHYGLPSWEETWDYIRNTL